MIQTMPNNLPNTTSGSNSLTGGSDSTVIPTNAAPSSSSPTLSGISQGGVEKEPIRTSEMPQIEEFLPDIELSPELSEFGIQQKSEQIELPPDIKQLGVTAAGPAQSMAIPAQTQTIKLPISDDQIMAGLHTKVFLSMRWLSEWCVVQLKKAHYHLRRIGGQVVREQD